jgi:hypothetical protein
VSPASSSSFSSGVGSASASGVGSCCSVQYASGLGTSGVAGCQSQGKEQSDSIATGTEKNPHRVKVCFGADEKARHGEGFGEFLQAAKHNERPSFIHSTEDTTLTCCSFANAKESTSVLSNRNTARSHSANVDVVLMSKKKIKGEGGKHAKIIRKQNLPAFT